MKLTRLSSTTQRPSQEAVERVRQVDERVRRVELLEGAEGDRQRTLQQEMAEIEPAAMAAFQGGGQILQEAQGIAEQLAHLTVGVDSLIKPGALPTGLAGVDESA